MTKLRVFLADDHPMIRAGLRSLINSDPEMTVVGEATNGIDAVRQVSEVNPDVLVLDISMPKLTGTEVAAQLKQSCPHVKILALSVHEDRTYIREMLTAGASGYVLKRAASEELQRALWVVASGGFYVDPSVSGELVKTLVYPEPGQPSSSTLSEREEKVLHLVADGYSTKEIAAFLHISVKTVETYRARGMEKLQLSSRVDIVSHAKTAGWFQKSSAL